MSLVEVSAAHDKLGMPAEVKRQGAGSCRAFLDGPAALRRLLKESAQRPNQLTPIVHNSERMATTKFAKEAVRLEATVKCLTLKSDTWYKG